MPKKKKKKKEQSRAEATNYKVDPQFAAQDFFLNSKSPVL